MCKVNIVPFINMKANFNIDEGKLKFDEFGMKSHNDEVAKNKFACFANA